MKRSNIAIQVSDINRYLTAMSYNQKTIEMPIIYLISAVQKAYWVQFTYRIAFNM